MRSLFRLLKTASPVANILAVASLFVLLVKIFALNRLPAHFEGAFELGQLVDAVLSSVVASYVFYLLVVHLKEQTDRATLRPYIHGHSRSIVAACREQLGAIGRAASVGLELDSITLPLVTDAMTKVAPYSEAPLTFGASAKRADWFQYFHYHLGRTKRNAGRVLAQLLYIDARLIRILTTIDECGHFAMVEMARMRTVSNTDLSSWAPTFYEYCQMCKQLDEYLNTTFRAYAEP